MTRHAVLDLPDALRCGCEAGATAPLIPVDEALDRALDLVARSSFVELVPLSAATGRVTGKAVCTSLPLPPFDNAAMDGYALDPAGLTGDGPWSLPVSGHVRAGDAPDPLVPGTAVRILTGAAVPDGVTAVVAQEEVQRDGDVIVLHTRPAPGACIRRAGCDLAAGGQVLPAGCLIGPRQAAALAAAGQGQVMVRPRLRVAILSTGSELAEPGAPLAPGQIWNANRALLFGLLADAWVTLTDLGALPDTPDRLTDALVQGAATADLIVTTGGVSVGDEDHMPDIVRRAGGRIHAMKLAMKPGKPVTIGTLGHAIWLGLPGNPVAAFVTWTVLGAPLARAMAGLTDIAPRKSAVRLAAAVEHKRGRCDYRLARRLGHDALGVEVVDCLSGAGSHRSALLAQAEGLALIPADTDRMDAGDLVQFLPF